MHGYIYTRPWYHLVSSAAEGHVLVVALEQLGSGFMFMTPVATKHHEDVQGQFSHLIPG